MSLQNIINGRPTRIQVEKAFDRVKGMADGDVVSHEDIAKIIGEHRDSNRYRTIIYLLKKRCLKELGVALVSEHNVGYRRCTGFDQVRHGTKTIHRNVQGIGRAVNVIAAVADDRLPDGAHRKMRDFVLERAAYLAQLGRTHRKEIELTVGKPELLLTA